MPNIYSYRSQILDYLYGYFLLAKLFLLAHSHRNPAFNNLTCQKVAKSFKYMKVVKTPTQPHQSTRLPEVANTKLHFR